MTDEKMNALFSTFNLRTGKQLVRLGGSPRFVWFLDGKSFVGLVVGVGDDNRKEVRVVWVFPSSKCWFCFMVSGLQSPA